MKKKLVATLLMAAMSVTLIAGCGSKAAEEGTATAPATESTAATETAGGTETASGDITDITVSYWSLAKVPEEVNKVEDAINAITEKEIGVHVKLNVMDVGSYIPNGAMATAVSNKEDYDVVLTAPALSGHFSTMYSNGMLMPIDDLLKEYAPDLLKTVPEQFMKATTINGKIYGVPVYGDKVANMYWAVRKSVAEKAGIDVASITDTAKLEAALMKIKETNPDMIPMGGNSLSMNLTFPGFAVGAGKTSQSFDTLGESTAVAAVVDYDDASLNAVSRYESDAFKTDMNLLKKWYDAGLLDKDVATDTATSNAIQDKSNVASMLYTTQEKIIGGFAKTNDCEYVKLASGTVGTAGLLQFTWALPVSCDEPEASAKFLNLLYTDERIVNLIDYGVEGVHYVKEADGTIGFPDGITADNSGYYMGGISELVGNAFLAATWQGGDPESATKGKAEMDGATYSPLLGFSLDTSKVADIYAQLSSIANKEYGPALFCGSAPDGYYDEFISKMKAAGLDDYLKEANSQIQAWKAAQ